MKSFIDAVSLLPESVREQLLLCDESDMKRINEIRFRVGRPVTLNTRTEKFYITKSGRLTYQVSLGALTTDENAVNEIVISLARRSLHTYQDMIARGFIPLKGGCKAGVAGCAVIKNGCVSSVSSFNSVNIRIAREYAGCSSEVLRAVGENCRSFLLTGPPLSGKTSILRDLCRFYSGAANPDPKKTVIIDERDEIASASFGAGADVGVHTDILSLYPKALGADIALRTLSPDIMVLDEIGAADEVQPLLDAFNGGVDIIATAHAASFAEAAARPNIKKLLDGGVFKKVIVLKGKATPCEVSEAVKL